MTETPRIVYEPSNDPPWACYRGPRLIGREHSEQAAMRRQAQWREGGRDGRRERPVTGSRNVAGYVKRMRRVARLRARYDREQARLRPLADALHAALADAQVARGKLTGAQLADAGRRLADAGPAAPGPTGGREEGRDG